MTYVRPDEQPLNHEIPATHALIIAVGNYESNTWGLENLGSPIASAAAFTEWLLKEYHNPSAPLASVDVLWSPAGGPQPFRVGNREIQIEPATMDNVSEAIESRWFNLCHTSPENVGMFFFCGHGLQRGLSKSLLLEGFAKPGRREPGADVIDFDKFAAGMETCLARRQIYFLDSCQTTPPQVKNLPFEFGRAIISLDYSKIPTTLARSCPAYCAASEGQRAFGDVGGGVSRFTAALLRGLRGCAWDDRERPWNKWVVNADTLVTFVRQLLKFEEEVLGAPVQDARVTGSFSGFVVHEPPAGTSPVVDLMVRQPNDRAATEFNLIQNRAIVDSSGPTLDDWKTTATVGEYLLTASRAGNSQDPRSLAVRPACTIFQW